MAITAYTGPLVSFGITQSSTGQVQEYNEERGPSVSDLGYGMMDPRPFYQYRPGNPVGSDIAIHYNNRAMVDYVPSTINTCAIAVSTSNAPSLLGTSGALTLLTTNSSGSMIYTTIVAPETGTNVTVIAIDSTAATLQFGSGGTVAAWNPRAGTGRVISVVTASSGDTGVVTVSGRDMYGFKMTENIVLSTAAGVDGRGSSLGALGAGLTSGYYYFGRKAFKYISGVTAPSATVTSTAISIGVIDIYGMPLYAPYYGFDTQVMVLPTAYSSGGTIAMSTANAVVATTATQTSTTYDSRGLFVSSAASNGTLRLQIMQKIGSPMVAAVTSSDTSILYGQTQFSSV